MLKYTICFIKRGNELLLLNRLKSPNMGLWNGVGGKLEREESPHAGIIREIYEETGLSIKDVKSSGIVKWISPSEESGMYLYVAELPVDTQYVTPVAVDEGILTWKTIDWVLHPDNYGVVDNIKFFLPHILKNGEELVHIFNYNENDQLIAYSHSPLLTAQS